MDGGVLLENLQDENIKRTRSGRISMPRLAWWVGERVMTTLKENDSPKYIAPSTIDKIGISILPTDIYERQKRMSTTIAQNSMVNESTNARPSTSTLACNPQRRSSGGVRQSARTRSKQPAALSKTEKTQKNHPTNSASFGCSSQVSKTRLAKKHPDALVSNNRASSKSGATDSELCSKLAVVVLKDIHKTRHASKKVLQKQTHDAEGSRLFDCVNASVKKGNTQFGNAKQLEHHAASSALSSPFSQDSLLSGDDLSSTMDGTFVIASKKAKTDVFNAPLCPIQDLCNSSSSKQSAAAKRSSNDGNSQQQSCTRDSVILSLSGSEDEADDDGYSDDNGCHEKVKQSQKRMPSKACQVTQKQFPISCSRRMESELHYVSTKTVSAEKEEVPPIEFRQVHRPQKISHVKDFAVSEPLGGAPGKGRGASTTCSERFVTLCYGKQTGKNQHGNSLHNRSKHVPHKGDDDDLINFLPEMPEVAVQRGKQATNGEPIDDSHSMSFHEVVRSIEKKMAAVQQKCKTLEEEEEEECCPNPRKKLQTRVTQLVSIRGGEDQEGTTGVAPPQDKRRNREWEPLQGSETEDSEERFTEKEEQLVGRAPSSQQKHKGCQYIERTREMSSSDEEVLQLHEENAEKPFHDLRPRRKIHKLSEEFCHSSARRGQGNKENYIRKRTARTKDIGYIFDNDGSKKPGRDTIKRKKWLAAMMEECNKGHNDDMFEGKDEFSIKELFSLEKQFGHDQSKVDLDFNTPKLNHFRIGNQEKKAYNVITCSSPSEFNCNRQAADEYLYRRNKMYKEKRSGNMVSSSKTAVPVDIEMQEAAKNVDEMLRRINPKLSDSEISSEELNDYYFSDEEDSPFVFRNYI